jgi:hypothetical protein
VDDENAVLKDRLAKIKIERHIRALGEKGLSWTFVFSLNLRLLWDSLIKLGVSGSSGLPFLWKILKAVLVHLLLTYSK